MNTHYNKSYTRDEIESVLQKIKNCINDNAYTISLNSNRQENIDFINEYNIRADRQKEILLGLKVEDFCHSLKNTKAGFEHEVLYVFIPKVELFDATGYKITIAVYTKFNIIERGSKNNTVVISFHQANKEADYLFT